METTFRVNTDLIVVKIIIIAVLTLIMLIPINMIRSLIEERENNQKNVQKEINSKWGASQCIAGPILVVPYEIESTENNQPKVINYAYFLPDDIHIEGEIKPEERSRSMYPSLVYQSALKIKGKFKSPKFEKLNITPEQIKWDDVSIFIEITDLQGIKNKIEFNVNDKPLMMQPDMDANHIKESGLTLKMPIDKENIAESYNFDFNLNLNGSSGFYVVPVGKESHIHLKSPWKTVSFTGSFLPVDRTINKKGFDAKWDIFDYNRNYSQMWIGNNDKLAETTIGVDFKFPIDQYQMSMRSVKYAIMFIALTFIAFFLIEVLSRNRIHPVQYLLVSFALILFYSLLLALSEHIGFTLSYLVSASVTIALITAYSTTIFQKKKHTMLMGAFLTTLYIYLYIMLQMEDMALLFGSIGLFVVLAIIMYISRKINWYKSDEIKAKKNEGNNTPPPFIPKNDIQE